MKKILDWDLYCQTARNAIAEGCVLLENKGTLPLKKDSTVSVFGRIQSNYYKSGTGSGGKVNVTKVWNIVEGLEESGLVKVNQELKTFIQNGKKIILMMKAWAGEKSAGLRTKCLLQKKSFQMQQPGAMLRL